MEKIIILILASLGIGVLFYVLYINGYIITQVKTARRYTGSIRGNKNGSSASFLSCHGYTKRRIRFKESREYEFELQCNISKGTLKIEIQNAGRQNLLVLDEHRATGLLSIDANNRYYLVVHFGKADGNYQLKWK